MPPLQPPAPVPIASIAVYDIVHVSYHVGTDVIEVGWVGLDAPGGNVVQRGSTALAGGLAWYAAPANRVNLLGKLATALGVVGGTVT